MKLRILSIMLLAGSIIARADPVVVFDDAVIEIQAPILCTNKCEKMRNFIKNHKYKIAAAVTAIVGVGSAVYCYYHGMPKCLERFKKTKNVEKEQNKNIETKKKISGDHEIEIKKLTDNIENAIENNKSPYEKHKMQKDYCEYLVNIGKENWTYANHIFTNKNDGRVMDELDLGLPASNRKAHFVKTVDRLYLEPHTKNIFIKSFDESTYNSLLNFELVVAEKSLDRFDFSIIQELRNLFRDNIIDKAMYDALKKNHQK